MSRPTMYTLTTAIMAALVMPAAAQAAKRTVFMGAPPASQDSFQKRASEVNAFFPSNIRIHRGDTVAFTPVGFHTVDFPPRGGRAVPFYVPTGKVTGVTDAAGAPFWFNGRDKLAFNPLMFRSNFGKTVTKGAGRVESGLPLADKPKPMNVRFGRTGLFTYFCDVHPGMRGTVRVVARNRPAQSPRAIALSVRRQTASALTTAKSLAATKPPANVVSVGAAGGRGVEHMGFLPAKLTVAVGTSVRFAMPARSTEAHTATTGPGNPMTDPKSYLGTISGSYQGPTGVDPRATYPSEQPPAVAALTPLLHGNGFWNSGELDAISASPFAPANTVQFAAPGTYEFYCVIHPFMHATVTAQ
ncbi:MAG TPA: hypothetical protein VNA28_05420 [Solirubrobacteraceae bacterium]|nr:hypothetical protein [Solirubrobacteraceae bacterium]